MTTIIRSCKATRSAGGTAGDVHALEEVCRVLNLTTTKARASSGRPYH